MTGAVGVLLAGGLRHSLLRRQTGCAIGILPVNEYTSLLGTWLQRFSQEPRIKHVLIVASDMVDRDLLEQAACESPIDCKVEIIVDPNPHRGTAGVLHDVVLNLPWNLVILGEVSAVPPHEIREAIDVVELGDAVMSVGISELQRPIGVYAMLRMALDHVPRIGYFDLKEQLISSLANAGHVVRPVVLMPRHLRLADLEGWLGALRFFDGGVHPESDVSADARLEGLVCIMQSATIQSGAAIRDSLVMEGAIVESDTVVARSVVGPGMRIEQGHRIIDGILIKRLDIHNFSDGIAPVAIGTGRLRTGSEQVNSDSEGTQEMMR